MHNMSVNDQTPLGHHEPSFVYSTHGGEHGHGPDITHNHRHGLGHSRYRHHGYYGWGGYSCNYVWRTVLGLILFAFLVVGFIFLVDTRSAVNHLTNVRRFCLQADGDQVEPGPGDGNGKAFGPLIFDLRSGEIVWNLIYTMIAEPDGLAIHGPLSEGSPNETGVFIPLNTISAAGSTGVLVGNLFVAPDLIKLIFANPSLFYVSVDNGPFPDGAVRAGITAVC